MASNPSELMASKIKGHLAMARISNSPTVVTNVLAGTALAGGFVGPNVWSVMAVCILLLMFYTGGMYLNDLCDFKIDQKERVERPLVQGLVSKREAWAVVIVLFVSALIGLALLKWELLWLGLLLVALIALYDLWHKRNPISPVIMGANRFMVYMIAFSAFADAVTQDVLLAGGLLWSYIIGVTLVAKYENAGEVKRYFPLAVLLLPLLFPMIKGGIVAWMAGIIFLVWTIYCARLIYHKSQIKRGVAALLAGICLLDGLIMSSAIGMAALVISVFGLALTLYLHRFIKGT